MVEWIFGLAPVLSDVVEKILARPVSLERHSLLLFELRESDLPAKYAAPLARLLRHVLASVSTLASDCQYADEVTRTLLASGADRQDLLAICQAMARLGCPTANTLRTLIEGTGQNEGG